MARGSISPGNRLLHEEIGQTDALIRISVGIERVDDLIADVARRSAN